MLRIRNVDSHDDPVLTIRKGIVDRANLAYFLVANRPIKYDKGRNRIVYIGTTSRGAARIMSSAAERVYDAFSRWGISRLDIHVIACTPRQRLKSWTKLERASILAFRELHGRQPLLNGTGHAMKETDEFEWFNKNLLQRFIRKFKT